MGFAVGLGVANGSSDALFFYSGGESEQHGYFGTLTVNPFSVPKVGPPSMTDVNLTVSTVISAGPVPPQWSSWVREISSFWKRPAARSSTSSTVRCVGIALDLAVNSASSAACWESLCSRTSTFSRCLSLRPRAPPAPIAPTSLRRRCSEIASTALLGIRI